MNSEYDPAIENWLLATAEVTVPEPAQDAAGSLPTMDASRLTTNLGPAQLGCDEELAPPTQESGGLQVLVNGSNDQAGLAQTGTTDVTVDVTDVEDPDGQTRELDERLPIVAILTLDGRIVDLSPNPNVDAAFVPHTLPITPGATRQWTQEFSGVCGTPLEADEDYEVWVRVAVQNPGQENPEQQYYVAGPWPLVDGEVQAPAPEATGTPEVTAPPGLEDLVISADGLGPLAFAEPLPTETGPSDIVRWDDRACAGTDTPGRWVTSYPDWIGQDGASVVPFTVDVSDNQVTRINVYAPDHHTEAGIQVGSTLRDVVEAYDDIRVSDGLGEPGGPINLWYVDLGSSTLYFEVSSNANAFQEGSNTGAGGWWTPDQVGQIVAMVAVPNTSYDYQAWGSDPCE